MSKNAIINLNDLLNKLTKNIGPDLDSIFKTIKKDFKYQFFYILVVRLALISLCSNWNELQVVILLLNLNTSRAVPSKVSIVNAI